MPNRNELAPRKELLKTLLANNAKKFALALSTVAVKVVIAVLSTVSITLLGALTGLVVGFVLPLPFPAWAVGATVAFVSNVWKEAQ